MGAIHIENVDDRVLTSIRLRAGANGRSLEDEVCALLSEVAAKARTPAERAAEMARIQAMTPKGVEQADSTEIIRELRDSGYAGR